MDFTKIDQATITWVITIATAIYAILRQWKSDQNTSQQAIREDAKYWQAKADEYKRALAECEKDKTEAYVRLGTLVASGGKWVIAIDNKP